MNLPAQVHTPLHHICALPSFMHIHQPGSFVAAHAVVVYSGLMPYVLGRCGTSPHSPATCAHVNLT